MCDGVRQHLLLYKKIADTPSRGRRGQEREEMFVTKGEPLRNGRFPVTSRQPVLLVVGLRWVGSRRVDAVIVVYRALS